MAGNRPDDFNGILLGSAEQSDNSLTNGQIYSIPLTWKQQNQVLLLLMSDAIGGYSSAYKKGSYNPDEIKKQREKDQKALEALTFADALQQQLNTLSAAAENLMKALIDIDPANKERIEKWKILLNHGKNLDAAINQMSASLDTLKTLRSQNNNAEIDPLTAGKKAENKAQREAAEIAEQQKLAEGKIVTIEYRFEDDIGTKALHAVYKENDKFYIKDNAGKAHYLHQLELTKDQKESIERSITWQSRKKSFGNQDEKWIAIFEQSNLQLQEKIKQGDLFAMAYEKYLANGKYFREIISQDIRNIQQKLDNLRAEKNKVLIEIKALETLICSTEEATKKFNELKEKLSEIDITQKQLDIHLKENLAQALQQSAMNAELTQYLSTKIFTTAEDWVQGLPDKKLRDSILEEYKERLEKIEEAQKKLDEQKIIAAAEEKKISEATNFLNDKEWKLKNKIDPLKEFNPSITREQWLFQQTTQDFVKDEKGNIISYDAAAGLFFRIEKTSELEEKRIIYRDTEEISEFFRQSWQENKSLGNEEDLKNIKYSDQEFALELHLGTAKKMLSIIRNALEMRQKNLDIESSEIKAEIEQTAAQAATPAPLPSSYRSSAYATEWGSTYTPAFNIEASPVTSNTQTGTTGPNTDQSMNEYKKPPVSKTSAQTIH